MRDRRPTQRDLYYMAERHAATVNEDFMWLVRHGGITREELARNIERRPALWSRFAGFLQTLPTTAGAVAQRLKT
jgi:hypothetical protein